MKYTRIICVTLLAATIAGCNPPPPGGGVAGISKQDIGMVAGGAGGAVIGSTMGGGRGRIATTAAGAILGGLAGSSVGKSLDRSDSSNNNGYYNNGY